ncbi:MAG TPA: hypothetical protein GX711_05985, partial [Clostridia bacterium]|nr:hypothetical protein [Clostridia bacterium]
MLLSDLPLNHNPVPLPTPRPPWFRLLLVLGLVGILALGGVLIWFGPGLITIPLDTSGEPTLIWQGEEITGRAVVRQKDNLYFHVPILQSLLDSNIFWDQEKGYLAITTKDQLVQMNSSQLTWFINQKPVELRFPLFM